VIERNRLADQIAPGAKTPLPQPIAEDRHALAARRVFGFSEGASQRRRYTENTEELFRNAHPPRILSFVAPGQMAACAAEAGITGQTLERLALLAPEHEFRLSRTIRPTTTKRLPDE